MKEYTETATRRMRVEEYIEFEERSDVRHERIENQLVPSLGVELNFKEAYEGIRFS